MMRHTPVAIVACLGCSLAAEAGAAEVFDSEVLEIVPVGVVPGDGETEVLVRVLARQADGSPWTGLDARALATEGTVGKVKSEGEGWYAFPFTPPATSQAVDVKLTVKAGSAEAVADIPVRPAGEASLEARVNPPSLVLGRADSATLSFQLEGAIPKGELEVTVSSGEVTDLTDMGGGSFTARYKAPSVNYPHLALISAVSKSRPDVAATAVIRLQGAVDFPVEAPEGTAVLLKIADADYGPVRMEAGGTGKVPIIVSPGITSARKVVVTDGVREESPFDLQIPETRRVAFVPVVGGVQFDGRPHPIRVVVRKPDGSPEGGADLALTADSGELSAPRHLGDGLYVADFTPAAAGRVTFSVDLPGTKKNQATLETTVLGALPDSVDWPGSGVPVSVGAPYELVVVPLSRVVEAGESVQVAVMAVDAHGYPVPNVSVGVGADSGSTGGSGVRVMTVEVPDAPGLHTIRAEAGGLSTATGVVVTNAPLELVWPRSQGAQGDWEGRLPQDATAVAVAAPDPEPKSGVAGSDGVISVLALEAPDTVSPGSSVKVVARAKTDSGAGVPGSDLEFLTNTGSFGDVTDNGDGSYSADLDIPKKASGELKISVVSPKGVMAKAAVPVDPGAVAKKPPKQPKTSTEPVDVPMLRVRLGAVGGSYSYAQRPSENPGPLLPASLIVGGAEGGRAASLAGVEADGRVWFLDYLGARVAFRGTSYSISAESFSDNAPDWIYHLRAGVTGRYPFQVGRDQFWVGATAGFQLDDFIVFKGCLEPGCDVRFEPLTLPGLEVGAELGAELGPVFFVGGLSRGFAFGTVGYRTGVDVDVGFEITDNLFVDLGGAFVSRRLAVEGESSGTQFGELEDGQLVGRLSLGFAL